MFVNLLSNAFGTTRQGRQGAVVAEATEPGTVTVKVADDGEGMPPELVGAPAGEAWLPRRAAAGSRGSGVGLGLSIAVGIVLRTAAGWSWSRPRGHLFL